MEVDHVADLATDGLREGEALDVGTGTGVFAEAFAKRGWRVGGVDANPDLLARATEYVPMGQFRQAPAEDLPFEDGSFDLVFLGHVLHETDDQVAALSQARRVARQRVAVLEWPYRDEEHGPPLEHRLRPDIVLQLAQQAGFSRVEHIELAHMDFYRMEP
jgi:ubiquinone/menaquinone biosynthesis C-methylase UbiE